MLKVMSGNADGPDITMCMNTYEMGRESYLATLAKVAKINDRAVKRGFSGRLSVTGTPKMVTRTGEGGIPVTYEVFDVTIDGTAPSYEGWTFLAAVDAVGESFVLRWAPGVDEASIDRSTLEAGRCEHCNTVRANRRYTYLVANEQGEYRQVGSTCIKDFLGWTGTPVFISTDEVEALFVGGNSADEWDPSLTSVLALALAATEKYGFRPSSFERSTRDTVSLVLSSDSSKAAKALRADLAPLVETAEAKVPAMVETLLSTLGSSEYAQNLRAVLSHTSVSFKHLGLAVSSVAAYQKALGIKEARQAREQLPASKWIGNLGEKVTVTGTISTAMTIDGYAYNTYSRLIVIATDEGIVKVTSAAKWAFETKTGQTVTVVGTVKDHGTYRDDKQTILTRCKLAETTAAPTS